MGAIQFAPTAPLPEGRGGEARPNSIPNGRMLFVCLRCDHVPARPVLRFPILGQRPHDPHLDIVLTWDRGRWPIAGLRRRDARVLRDNNVTPIVRVRESEGGNEGDSGSKGSREYEEPEIGARVGESEVQANNAEDYSPDDRQPSGAVASVGFHAVHAEIPLGKDVTGDLTALVVPELLDDRVRGIHRGIGPRLSQRKPQRGKDSGKEGLQSPGGKVREPEALTGLGIQASRGDPAET